MNFEKTKGHFNLMDEVQCIGKLHNANFTSFVQKSLF